ncbi:MAG: ABC transporter permease subunit [Alicyclobacillaceae bacterium]|nr:ABC transporter permease subunit [Alicyclobacillaceae bacterium]
MPKKWTWVDLVVALFVFGLLYAIVKLGTGMGVPLSEHDQPHIALHWWMLPYYAGRSLLRMFIAFLGSLLFTFVYGRIAATYRLAERILVPLLDILQSVPVLGFLSITVTGFMALFPHRLLGAELASIFAIFTSQVWNMTFGFYQSVAAIPRELREVSRVMHMDAYTRFTRLELPHAMVTLVWNSMMSFGGAWFFLAASESISVLGHHIQLPGIGSYMATAYLEGDVRALIEAIIAMIVVIILVDQLFWRPLVAWSQKFKMELSNATDQPTSWFLQFLRRSQLAGWLSNQVFGRLAQAIDGWMLRRAKRRQSRRRGMPGERRRARRAAVAACALAAAGLVMYYGYLGALELSKLGAMEVAEVFLYGFYTMLRVFFATLLALLWTIPVGVAIGLSPRASRIAQPLVQIAASFPANMFFPFVALLYLRWHVNFQLGAVSLMMLGTQWYILFNVIAGTMNIPNDLKEATKVLRLRGWGRWKHLLLPAIFPYVITGCITASGGAWNASILAELVRWKQHTLVASGLGSLITIATTDGNWPVIVLSMIVMAIFVTLINQLVWRPLMRLAERRYRMEISGR